eukprot:4408085-Pyramimonas_sp.AAC.1
MGHDMAPSTRWSTPKVTGHGRLPGTLSWSQNLHGKEGSVTMKGRPVLSASAGKQSCAAARAIVMGTFFSRPLSMFKGGGFLLKGPALEQYHVP